MSQAITINTIDRFQWTMNIVKPFTHYANAIKACYGWYKQGRKIGIYSSHVAKEAC